MRQATIFVVLHDEEDSNSDVESSVIHSRASSRAYSAGWERTFAAKKEVAPADKSKLN